MQSNGQSNAAQLAQVLEELRLARGWSQVRLSRRADSGDGLVARIETQQVNKKTGKVDMPKPSTLRKLAYALGDGSAERTKEAQRKLFAAAGYSEDDILEEPDSATEIAHLRERIEALERERLADPAVIEAQLWRALESYTPEEGAAAVTLWEKAIERYKRSRGEPSSTDAG